MKSLKYHLFMGFLLVILIISSCHDALGGEGEGTIIRTKASLLVTVLDEETGKGISSANITIYSSGGEIVVEGNTGDDGTFYVQVDAGSYTLEVFRSGYELKTIPFTVSWGESKFIRVKLGRALVVRLNMRYIRATAGSKVIIPMTLMNRGKNVEICTLKVLGIDMWNADFTLNQISVKEVALDPGNSVSLSLTLSVPHYVRGLYNLTVIVNGSVVVETPVIVEVEPLTEHILRSTVSSIRVLAGEALSLDGISVTNPLDEYLQVLLEVEAPESWDVKLLYQGIDVRSLNLPPGAQYSLKLMIEIPDSAREGEQRLVIRALDEKGNVLDAVTLVVEVSKREPYITLYADTPHINVYTGSKAHFRIKIRNEGTADTVVNLNVEGLPSTFTYAIEDESGNKISSLFVKEGSERVVTIRVNVPTVISLSEIGFNLTATYLDKTIMLPLSLTIVGEKNLEILTENFLVSGYLGEDTEFACEVRNNGTITLTDLRLVVTDMPSDFNVTVSPETISLSPGEEGTFYMKISIPGDVAAGDYYISFRIISSDYISPEYMIRVEVRQSTSYTLLGGVAAIAMIVLLVVAYRKYGRR